MMTFLPAAEIYAREQGHLYKLSPICAGWHKGVSAPQLEEAYDMRLTGCMVSALLDRKLTRC